MQRVMWLALVLSACQSSSTSDKPATGSSSGSASTPPITTGPVVKHLVPTSIDATDRLPEPVVVLPKLVSFSLVSPGTGTLSKLRYHYVPSKLSLSTTVTSRTALESTWTDLVTLPTIVDGFEITSVAPAKDGATRLSMRALAPKLSPGGSPDAIAIANAQLARWRAQVSDRRFDVVVDARGQLGAVVFADDATGSRSSIAIADLQQRLLGSWIPLPEEPVGAGANWRVVTILRQGTAVVKQTATYTLAAVTPNEWTINVESRRVGEAQRVRDAAMPKGMSADLVALVRDAKGTVTLSPRAPQPSKGELAISMTVHGTITEAGKTTTQLSEDNGNVVLSTSF